MSADAHNAIDNLLDGPFGEGKIIVILCKTAIQTIVHLRHLAICRREWKVHL